MSQDKKENNIIFEDDPSNEPEEKRPRGRPKKSDLTRQEYMKEYLKNNREKYKDKHKEYVLNNNKKYQNCYKFLKELVQNEKIILDDGIKEQLKNLKLDSLE